MKPDILKQTRYSSEPVPHTWFHAQLVFKCIVFEATYFIHSYIYTYMVCGGTTLGFRSTHIVKDYPRNKNKFNFI